MSMISLVSAPVTIEARAIDHSFATIVLACCVGLVASFALMAQGIDLSAGLI
jgi:hypothetical protein